MTRYVLDSFAILASYRGEAGSSRVGNLLTDRTHSHWMTYVNAGEVYYQIAREQSVQVAEDVLRWLEALPITFMEADRELTLEAARLKSLYAISYADCFATALALRVNAAVITGDPEFRKLELARVIDIEWLPAKPKTIR